MATVTMTTTLTEVEFADDRFAGVDIDSLLRGGRRTLSVERRRALYEAPEFIQRLSGEETVLEGQSLCIECKIRGFPVPSVRWFKDDEEILDHPRIHVESNGIGSYFLLIDCVNRGDEAAYRCRAENIEGACSSFLFLSVKGKPKKREPMFCPSWRTVSYPPMFSTIVEKVEEEEKQAQECQGLPPPPLTEFYYALTLKSRCSWPTFLGAWAFANGGPVVGRRDDEYDNNDDNEEDIEDDDIHDIDNKFCIPNGDICDNLMTRSSSKAHLTARKKLRRKEIAAKKKVKKQKIDEEVDNQVEKQGDSMNKDKHGPNSLGGDKEEERSSNIEIKRLVGGIIKNTEMDKRLEMERAENEEYEKRERSYIEEEEMRKERHILHKERKEDINRKDEKEESYETISNDREKLNNDSNTWPDDVTIGRSKDIRTEQEFRSINDKFGQSLQINETHNGGVAYSPENARLFEDYSRKEKFTKDEDKIENEFKFTRNRLEEENNKLKYERNSEKTLEHDDGVLKSSSRTRDVQHTDNSQVPGPVSKKETAHMPDVGTIPKYAVCDDFFSGRIVGSNKLPDTKYKLNKNSKITFEESHVDRKGWQEKISQCSNTVSRTDNNNRRSQVEDTHRWGSYRNDQRVSIETDFLNSRRHLQQREVRGQRQISCRDRLEELRQEEEKRMEELKQHELDRMEELKQEEAKASWRRHRRETTQWEDYRTREKKQIEELRRKEQLQREELWQKELKQREDLRNREEKQKEELKLKGGPIEILTSRGQQQQEEELVKIRQELRHKELNQKVELKLRELQHKEEFKLKDCVQDEELMAHEKNQIEKFRLKEWRQIEEIGANQQTDNPELQEHETRTKQQLRVECKKEQLRKEQLRRQYEEEQKKRENKQIETKRHRERALDWRDGKEIYKPSYLSSDVHRISGHRMRGEDITAEEPWLSGRTLNNLGNSSIHYYSAANKENEHSIKGRTNSKDDTDFSITNQLDSRWTESWTRSLGRPHKIASGNLKQPNDEEYHKRLSTRADPRQQHLENNTTQIGSRKSQTHPRPEEDRSTNNRDNNYLSSRHRNEGSHSTSVTAHSSTSRSFASLFNLDETRGSKPGLLSHQDLLQLAESIAAEREMFHESLSLGRQKDRTRPVSNAPSSTAPSLRRDADTTSDTGVYKRAVGRNNGKSEEGEIQEDFKQSDRRIIRDSQKDIVSPSALIKTSSCDDVAVDPTALEIRPFICQSSRTIARRFYKKEIPS